MHRTRQAPAPIALATLLITAVAAAILSSPRTTPHHESQSRLCSAELRSWVVAGWSRHLYLDIFCPSSHAHLNGRIEFSTALLRPGYDPDQNTTLDAPPLIRMGRQSALAPPPFAPPPDHRLEHTYPLTTTEARCLQLDRLYSTPYILTEANSNAAINAALNECGLELPPHINTPQATQPLGTFPGALAATGPAAPPERWPALRLPDGPRPIPDPRNPRDQQLLRWLTITHPPLQTTHTR